MSSSQGIESYNETLFQVKEQFMIRSRYAITDFPDGTHLIKFDMHDKQHTAPNAITWLYESMSEFADIAMIASNISENRGKSPMLTMPYIPNARMDRTKEWRFYPQVFLPNAERHEFFRG